MTNISVSVLPSAWFIRLITPSVNVFLTCCVPLLPWSEENKTHIQTDPLSAQRAKSKRGKKCRILCRVLSPVRPHCALVTRGSCAPCDELWIHSNITIVCFHKGGLQLLYLQEEAWMIVFKTEGWACFLYQSVKVLRFKWKRYIWVFILFQISVLDIYSENLHYNKLL